MDPKRRVLDDLTARRGALVDVSHRIHAHPELGFSEERASTWLCEALADGGLEVTRGVADLPTAFEARAGSGDLELVVCAEYDCLADIGHACGHNIIAAAALGAGLALMPIADDLGITVRVLGTPAEEGGGGKILMLQRGAFEGAHAAMMVHPFPANVVEPNIVAASHFHVAYEGREAHAGAAPQRGRNAADAFVVAQTAIGLLRQHLDESARVHGWIEHAGDAVNVVPAHTYGAWMVRGPSLEAMRATRARVEHCFEAGALATGTTLTMSDISPDYAHMAHDHGLAACYARNAEALDRGFPDEASLTFSTDMGNVSLAIPSIHPTLEIDSAGAMNHEPDFAAACVNASADQAVLDGAISMAWTAIDIASGPERERLLAPSGDG